MSNTHLTQQQIQQNLQQGAHNAYLLGVDLIMCLIIIAPFILFILSLRKTMQYVPAKKRVFPNWFIWLFAIPVIGYIFKFLMLPFGIPNSLRNMINNNALAVRSTNSLKKIGLIICTLTAFLYIIYGLKAINITLVKIHAIPSISILIFMSYIFYWKKITTFRKKYLITNNPIK